MECETGAAAGINGRSIIPESPVSEGWSQRANKLEGCLLYNAK